MKVDFFFTLFGQNCIFLEFIASLGLYVLDNFIIIITKTVHLLQEPEMGTFIQTITKYVIFLYSEMLFVWPSPLDSAAMVQQF